MSRFLPWVLSAFLAVTTAASAAAHGHSHSGGHGHHGHHHHHGSATIFLVPHFYPSYPVLYEIPPGAVVYDLPPPFGPPAYCHEFRGNAVIDGALQPFYGTACWYPDWRWHVVR